MIIIVIIVILIIYLNIKPSKFSETCTPIQLDKAFVLTLGTDSQRYKTFINSYNLSIPLEVILGINTKIQANAEHYRHLVDPEKFNLMYDFDKRTKIRPNHGYFNSGALGCYLGHMEFYKKSFEQNLKYSIVFEDNVVLESSFARELNDVLKRIPNDFDVIFLHSFKRVSNQVIKCDKEIDLLKWINSTKCYFINVQNMKKYYNLFYPIETHVDLAYEKLIFNGAKVYYIKMNSIKVMNNTSTINHTGVLENKRNFYFDQFKQYEFR